MTSPERSLAFDRVMGGALILGALAAAAVVSDAYLQRLLAVAGCYAILAIGYQRIFGELGVLSLAQGAFFAVGGYAAAILSLRTSWDGVLLLSAAIVASVLLAILAAPAMLKLASHYFALASLALAQLVLLAAINFESFTGGSNGLSPLPPFAVAGVVLPPGAPMTLAIWGAAAVTAILFWLSGPLAALRRLVLREAPLAAQAMGIDAPHWRLAAFTFAAGCGGLAGGFYVQATGVAAPDIAEFAIAVNVLAITVIGGRGRIGGAVLGALLLAFLPEALRFLGGWQLFAWGAAMLVMLILAPDGLAGLLHRALGRQKIIVAEAPGETRSGLGTTGTLSGTHLRKNFGGVIAVDDASLQIGPKEIVGLIGGNGAGKTTLLNLLSGFETPDTGSIEWRGGNVTKLATSRRARLGIGRSFQTDQLPSALTALDAVAAAVWQTRSLPTARVTASTLLRRLGLGDRCAEPLDTLPPAARRLVDIARALATSPGVLLLDEPTAGLSASERDGLGRVLASLRDEGLGMAIVEHDLAFLLPLVDRLVCLRDGRIVAEGPPADLAHRPELRDFFAGYRAAS